MNVPAAENVRAEPHVSPEIGSALVNVMRTRNADQTATRRIASVENDEEASAEKVHHGPGKDILSVLRGALPERSIEIRTAAER